MGVIAQRLIRTVCLNCKTSYFPSTELLNAVHYHGNDRRQFIRGEGCRNCYDTGFKGRVGVYEVFQVDRTIRELIANMAQADELERAHVANRGTLLRDHGIVLRSGPD